MDARTGHIHHFTREDLETLAAGGRKHLIPLTDHEARTLEPMSNGRRKNNMRNKPCICGSGSKFKKCCWGKYA